MSFAVRFLVKPFVVLHVESHAALLALEAELVPYSVQTVQFLGRVDSFTTCSTWR